ncbi:unnamed protein product, partial [Amoebophrya sp. A25]
TEAGGPRQDEQGCLLRAAEDLQLQDAQQPLPMRYAARMVAMDSATGEIPLLHCSRDLFWKLPGGGIEAGETPEEAVIRECREELGCEVVVEKSYGSFEDIRQAEENYKNFFRHKSTTTTSSTGSSRSTLVLVATTGVPVLPENEEESTAWSPRQKMPKQGNATKGSTPSLSGISTASSDYNNSTATPFVQNPKAGEDGAAKREISSSSPGTSPSHSQQSATRSNSLNTTITRNNLDEVEDFQDDGGNQNYVMRKKNTMHVVGAAPEEPEHDEDIRDIPDDRSTSMHMLAANHNATATEAKEAPAPSVPRGNKKVPVANKM